MKEKEEVIGNIKERTSKYFSPKSSKISLKNKSTIKNQRVSAKMSQKIITEKKLIFTANDKHSPLEDKTGK